MRRAVRGIAAFVLVAAAGCAVGPDHRAPEARTAAAWTAAADARVGAGAPDIAVWWTTFGDPVLTDFVAAAQTTSPDARTAAARVREARARVGVAESGSQPTLDAVSSYERGRGSRNVSDVRPGDPVDDLSSVGVEAAWRLDLFGRVRREAEAAEADARAAAADRDAVLVALAADVGRAYAALRGAGRRLDALRANEQAASDTVELTKSRVTAGLATGFDVARAEAQLADVRSRIPPAEAERALSIHRLSVLTGKSVQEVGAQVAAGAAPLAAPTVVAAGVPADLLARRPDVRRAELALHAETARVGVAVADLYPDVSLAGAFGLAASSAEGALLGSSRAWSVGPALRWPIFDGGRIRAQIAAQDARAERAAAEFDGAVLRALADVEDAMTSWLRSGDRRTRLAERAAAARDAASLARSLRDAGGATFLDVLDAERSLFEAEEELARGDTAVARDAISLYEALGGGW